MVPSWADRRGSRDRRVGPVHDRAARRLASHLTSPSMAPSCALAHSGPCWAPHSPVSRPRHRSAPRADDAIDPATPGPARTPSPAGEVARRARRADPRRAVQRGAAGAARADPRRRPDRHGHASPGTRRRAPDRRERPRPGGVVPHPGRRDQGGAVDHAGRGVAGRQLPDRRRATPRDPRRPPPGLLPRAPQARRGPPRGVSTGPRSRLGLHRPHGQPLRSGEPAAHGPRLPGSGGADARRAVGDRDQPPDSPGREPPAHRGRARAEPGGTAGRGRARRRPAGPPHGQPGRRDGVPAAALPSGVSDPCPGPALPAPAGPGPGGHARPPLAGDAPRGPGDHRRGDGPPGAPAPGDDERDDQEPDHEHAADLVVRLGRVRRERQPGGRGARLPTLVRRRWTSRPGIATGTPSRSWLAAPA